MDKQPSPDYLAYLVRLWHEGEGVWRCTLENPYTGERRAFAHVESLCAFLHHQTNTPATPPPDDDSVGW